ncbi:CNH-domain-containing protein [Artomyces pyxidatus]|uniref:CNH-domain-containing protein n=1 Tax=Artomyces pyxidatus TaxID=48021 RepID=A0ACB8SXR7_9AGAM|nr:CNH-domain-containing protein [Artomyces pyxidatus]
MDRPLGPRQPDKRHEAYESIFGRPSAIHHQSGSPLNYPPPYPPNQYPYPQQQQQGLYASPPDRRTSYASSYTSSTQQYAPQQPSASNHRQSFYAQPSQTWTYAGSPYQQQPYSQPQMPSHASSVMSNPHAQGVLVAQPEESPDASLESLTRAGLTPAQAYQAQVYLNSPLGQQNAWATRANGSTFDYDKDPRYHNGGPSYPHPGNVPRLGVNIDADNGRLGLDFGEGSSPSDTDDGSELPWARSAQSVRSSHHSHHHHHHHHSQPPPQHHHHSSQHRHLSHSPPDGLSVRSAGSDQSAPSPPGRPYPLQLDTALMTQSARPNISPVSSTHIDLNPPGSSTRRSSESARTMPGGPSYRRERSAQDRSRSMSAATTAQVRAALLDGTSPSSSRPRPSLPPLPGSSAPSSPGPPRRTPIVYPALLSRVAEAFRARIALADRVKDGLTYKDAFDGRQAVDKIAYIIKTTDRNLALLLGRALDAQKYFHAVTYDHRLRDSSSDVYQFRTRVPSPFVSGEVTAPSNDDGANGHNKLSLPTRPASAVTQDSSSPNEVSTESDHGKPGDADSIAPAQRPRAGSISSDDIPLPTGVFTLLTDCYSPTCSRDHLCYSITCPRRLEQQARLNMKPQLALKKQESRESLGELELVEPGMLWIHSVPQEIVNSVSDQEKRRQEAINEVIYTERDFVRDMEYLRDVWIAPLKTSNIIPESRRSDFIEQVFWNVLDIIAVNTRLRDALNRRQKSYAVVENIADIFHDAVPNFGPFVSYGAHQLYGKYEFEKERSSNPAFAQFVEENERRPESRKLELNAYLTKPTTRLARYPLLLEAVLKQTPDDNSDKEDIPKVVELVREFLREVNNQTGKAENRFNLLQLDQQLVFRPGETVDLRLKDEGRELIHKGALNRRGQGDSGELQVFLFDHALLMVKQKSKGEQYKVYRRPIPLELLFISASDDSGNGTVSLRPLNFRQPRTLVKRNSFNSAVSKALPYPPAVPVKFENGGKGGFSITFVHLGRKYYQMTLWASTNVSHRKWVEAITRQQELMRERSQLFEMDTLSEGFFTAINGVNCAAPFNEGRKVVYGTYDGVYFSDLREQNRDPVKVLALTDVAQVDVLDDYGLLIVLSEGQVITFPLDALDAIDPLAGLKRAKRIASHTSFFKTGICIGRTFVCVVKTSPLSSTIKIFEPIDQNIRGRSKPTFRKLLQGGNDTLRIYREFYIPVQSSSIHFLKTRLCVACVNGFEIIDPDTLDTQGLLDPSDESLEFVRRRGDNVKPKPMAIYRIENEFLLCYDDFAFYINRTGHRSRKDFMVFWEGTPTAFALQYPYVLAFEPTFVEIRNVETGSMSQVIQGNNLRCLFTDTPLSTQSQSRMSHGSFSSTHSINQYGHQPYSANSYGGRQSIQSSYTPSPVLPPPYPPIASPYGGRAAGRDEIILVSDDRVMTLRMSLPGQ